MLQLIVISDLGPSLFVTIMDRFTWWSVYWLASHLYLLQLVLSSSVPDNSQATIPIGWGRKTPYLGSTRWT